MPHANHRFTVGDFECIAVGDGTAVYTNPATVLFRDAPAAELEQALRTHAIDAGAWPEWRSDYTCLLVDTGDHRVLVDTGMGRHAPTTGELIANLRALGVAPSDVDTVVLTHGHPDHVGGNVDAEGRLSFPEARHVMWRSEWAFWTAPLERTSGEPTLAFMHAFALKHLLPLRDRIELIEHETEIVPGVRAVAAPGHTHGHMALEIASGGERLLVLADAIMHPIHVEHPEWIMAFDMLPDETVATRRRLFRRAVAERSLVAAFHLPFPGLGHIVADDEGWRWQPLAQAT